MAFPKDGKFSDFSPAILTSPYNDYTLESVIRGGLELPKEGGLSTNEASLALLEEGLHCWEIGWLDAAKRRPNKWRVSKLSKQNLEDAERRSKEAEGKLIDLRMKIRTKLQRFPLSVVADWIADWCWFRGVKFEEDPEYRIAVWLNQEVRDKDTNGNPFGVRYVGVREKGDPNTIQPCIYSETVTEKGFDFFTFVPLKSWAPTFTFATGKSPNESAEEFLTHCFNTPKSAADKVAGELQSPCALFRVEASMLTEKGFMFCPLPKIVEIAVANTPAPDFRNFLDSLPDED